MDQPEAAYTPTPAACTQVLPALSRTKEPTLAGVYAWVHAHMFGLVHLCTCLYVCAVHVCAIKYFYCVDSKLFGKKTGCFSSVMLKKSPIFAVQIMAL